MLIPLLYQSGFYYTISFSTGQPSKTVFKRIIIQYFCIENWNKAINLLQRKELEAWAASDFPAGKKIVLKFKESYNTTPGGAMYHKTDWPAGSVEADGTKPDLRHIPEE